MTCEGKDTLGYMYHLGGLAVVHLMHKFRIYRPMHYCVDSCLFCVPFRDSSETLRIGLTFLDALFFKDGANRPCPALLKVLVDGFASEVL